MSKSSSTSVSGGRQESPNGLKELSGGRNESSASEETTEATMSPRSVAATKAMDLRCCDDDKDQYLCLRPPCFTEEEVSSSSETSESRSLMPSFLPELVMEMLGYPGGLSARLPERAGGGPFGSQLRERLPLSAVDDEVDDQHRFFAGPRLFCVDARRPYCENRRLRQWQDQRDPRGPSTDAMDRQVPPDEQRRPRERLPGLRSPGMARLQEGVPRPGRIRPGHHLPLLSPLGRPPGRRRRQLRLPMGLRIGRATATGVHAPLPHPLPPLPTRGPRRQ